MPPMTMPPTTRVGFLGPHGTFAEEALLTQPDLAEGVAVPFRDVPHVINAVEQGTVDLGIVPIENSIEGSIPVTLDTLAFDTDLLVQREVDLPVHAHHAERPAPLDLEARELSHRPARPPGAVASARPSPPGRCRRRPSP